MTAPKLPDRPIIRQLADAIFRDKGNGTQVYYHILPEYEIHINSIAANTTQEWHHHLRITETICVTSGTIEARWLENDGTVKSASLHTGDIFDVGGTVHTLSNVSDEACQFIVFRFVPDGHDKREMIKADRYADVI